MHNLSVHLTGVSLRFTPAGDFRVMPRNNDDWIGKGGGMGHPHGGKGNTFPINHSFDEVYKHIGPHGVSFQSTTSEDIFARCGLTRDKTTATIVFMGERNRHGSTCKACWGYRIDCSGSRIGQCAEALDQSF